MQTLTLGHEILGQITFKGEAENSLVYDGEIIRNIFAKGINYLVAEELLTPENQMELNSFIDKIEFGIVSNQLKRTAISYQAISDTGEAVCAAYTLFSDVSRIPVVDMVNTFLDDLCQLIVIVKHPKEELHGSYWMKYAEALLPSYYIEYFLIYEKAYDYILQNATEKQKKVFMENLKEDWASILAEDYARIRINDGLTEEEFSVPVHLVKHLDSYK